MPSFKFTKEVKSPISPSQISYPIPGQDDRKASSSTQSTETSSSSAYYNPAIRGSSVSSKSPRHPDTPNYNTPQVSPVFHGDENPAPTTTTTTMRSNVAPVEANSPKATKASTVTTTNTTGKRSGGKSGWKKIFGRDSKPQEIEHSRPMNWEDDDWW